MVATDPSQGLHEHWGSYLFEGIVLVMLGAAAIFVPKLATLATFAPPAAFAIVIFLGRLFFISGVLGLLTAFWMRQAPGYWWSLLSAILGLAVGILLIVGSTSGVIFLARTLTAFFVIETILSILFAFEHKRALPGRWGWLLLNGVVDLVLAAVVVAGLPGTAIWVLGLFVGIDLLSHGLTLVIMALYARGNAPA